MKTTTQRKESDNVTNTLQRKEDTAQAKVMSPPPFGLEASAPVQRMEEEEESMQMKQAPAQMQEEEEEMLQPKMEAVQMKGEEEEESMQMKTAQLQEEEEEEMMP